MPGCGEDTVQAMHPPRGKAHKTPAAATAKIPESGLEIGGSARVLSDRARRSASH